MWSDDPFLRAGRDEGQLFGSELCRGWAGDAGAAEAAIAARILGQILLMIALGEVEWRGLGNFGGDLAQPGRIQSSLVGRSRRLGGSMLLRRKRIDCRAVLG